jgi:hypothetical protein
MVKPNRKARREGYGNTARKRYEGKLFCTSVNFFNLLRGDNDGVRSVGNNRSYIPI